MSTKVNTSKESTILQKINLIQENYSLWAKVLISIFYVVGIIGMSIPSLRPYFQLLTPFHLMLSAGFMLFFHKEWNFQFILFLGIAFSIGFLSEVSGVQTGFPFGNYSYGPVLGVQLWEVPLIIGINWLILVYLSGTVLNGRIKNDWLGVLLGAVIMVLIDLVIEPVAIALDFWSWEGNLIPLSNYIGWFGVALIIQIFFRKLRFNKENQISAYLLINLITFFVILNFIL